MTRKSESDDVVHSGLLPLRIFSDATMSDTLLTTKFQRPDNILTPRRTIGNKWQLGGILRFLHDFAAALDAVNAARISAPRAKEQDVGVDHHHGGQHQRGGDYGFHFKNPICNE